MKKLIIYFTEDKKNYQTVTPSSKFNNDWKGLVDSITGSFYKDTVYYKCYFDFEII